MSRVNYPCSIKRAALHKAFVKAFGWSSGRRFLLVDVMTEQREAFERAENAVRRHRINVINHGEAVLKIKAELQTVDSLHLVASDTAENIAKSTILNRLYDARFYRLKRVIGCRRLPE